jgi:polyisoprenyl-teichoic acid--peptidoglycan teichoic acid transferase
MQSDQKNGPKPYKTYKGKGGGRPRTSSLDEELAGLRPPSRSPAHPRQEAASYPEHGRSEYRKYGPAPEAAAAGKKARRGRFRWWHIPVAVILALLVAAVVVVVLAWPGYKKFDRAVAKANTRIDAKTRAQLTPDTGWIIRKPTTILLLGTDGTPGVPARSDTIMLMRFDPGKRTINQLSIPRDTRVLLPGGRGYDKINTAMFWGGPALAVKVIKQFTGIPVNHVMVVNFQGFPRIVNAVGGVDLYVPKTLTTIAGSHARTVVFDKGMHHFDGKYAMLYVRIRHADDDFHRAARQQAFVQALVKKIAQPSNVTKLPEIGKRFMSGVSTDLTTNQILELAFLKWRARGGSKQVMVGAPAWIGGVAYVLAPSESARQAMIRRFLR